MHIFPAPPPTAAKALLASCALPTEDLTDEHFQHFFGCGPEEDPAGVIGLEILGSVALLRSLAVAEATRGSGCGKRLIQEAEWHAARQGIHEIYLLTNTAQDLFESVGYVAVSRDTAPPTIKSSSQFSALCPASTTLMHKRIAA